VSGAAASARRYSQAVRRVGLIAWVVLGWLVVPGGALAASPPTIDAPLNGAVIYGQPKFSGSAGNGPTDSTTVTVRICSGSVSSCRTASAAVQSVDATRSADRYSTDPSSALPDGNFTAQAEQDTGVGSIHLTAQFSQPVSFTVHNKPPVVELDSPGAGPLLTATPTITGTAETIPGDSSTVQVTVYPGGPGAVMTVNASVGPDGRYSAEITPALADGPYTVQASQADSGNLTGTSSSQTFTVKVNPPALTLEQPATGSSTVAASPVFSGAAGTELGDSPQITVRLYQGGRELARHRVDASGRHWSLTWPTPLPPGVYAVQAQQSDDAGHTTVTAPRAFRVGPAPQPIGSSVRLGRSGLASVTIGCPALTGTCSGDVLVLTVRRFRPIAGGPRGPIRVLFAYVSVPAGATATVSGALPAPVLRALRRTARVPVKVVVTAAPGPRISAVRQLLANNRKQ
jgi:large repetitive protein